MKTEAIEILIEKYFEGETSLQEEKVLKDYFQQKEVPAHLQQYQAQFSYFAQVKNTKLNDSFDLHFEQLIQNQHPKTISLKPHTHNTQIYLRWGVQIAASVLFFVSGLYIGKHFWQDKEPDKISTKTEIENLRNEIKVTQKKQAEMLDMLKESSASERIKAVNFSYKMKENSPEVLDALIETLNKDENTNVRLAAANALFTFRDVAKVRTALITSLKNQEDPVVKIALVNMMIAMKDKKAVKTIEEFLQNEPLPDVAKEAIRKKLNDI